MVPRCSNSVCSNFCTVPTEVLGEKMLRAFNEVLLITNSYFRVGDCWSEGLLFVKARSTECVLEYSEKSKHIRLFH